MSDGTGSSVPPVNRFKQSCLNLPAPQKTGMNT